ncbi:uncharacterized protein LOC143344482 [Colletes latitarsis]|uniref:uncharacterized protein LOC143344482 n=1 Tax=Colletes latitarsis TaxID=2605962 RepID=UPI004035A669
MAHGVSEVLGEGNSVKMVHQKQQSVVHQPPQQQQQQNGTRKSVGVMGSRRIFAPAFKLKVLDSYRNDIDCRGNQRATARKYGIHRRQIQKWLQCEDNLRNSCAESGNTGVVSSSVIPSAGVSKPDGTVTEATGPAVTPAAPALNLSLARLHGDELATQQGPPPLLPHPHGGSPSSPQYAGQSTTVASVLPVRIGYQEYSGNQETPAHHLRREVDDRAQVTDSVRDYAETRVDQEQQASYYVLNADGQREIETSVSFDGRNEAKVYQTLTSYRVSPHQAHRYKENEIIGAMVHHQQQSNRHRSHQNYGDVDSSVDGKSSYGLLLAPSMIKTERASPDSAATPGPCESTCSPGATRVPLSPDSHRTTSTSSTSSTMSVHFDSPRASASPCSRVHVHEHAHASPTPDSEKPIRQSTETTAHIEEKGTEEEEEVAEEAAEIGRAVVKEELHIEEEETIDEGREADASSYVDYQRPPADLRPASPAHDREGYSLPSSPRGPASSGRSSTSCSDSEMDPLDCSSGGHNSSNDLARRRSFSLRFKLDVLDAFHRDVGVAGNQRATARKFGINRRQVQKWLGQETELRGEIAVRGNSRQRLGPIQDAASGESPVDLRTSNYVSSLSHDRIEPEYNLSPPPLYCCDVGSSSSQHLPYYHHSIVVDPSSESEPATSCNLSCCMDIHATTPASSCYQETSLRGSCYSEPQNRLYCYSPREYSSEIASVEEFSTSKRPHCTLSCCYEPLPSPKRLCLEADEPMAISPVCQEPPPQDTPLCLVKPKRLHDGDPSRTEPVTSTVPTPPASAAPPPPGPTSKKDAILFKPYLDNPVSKPAKEHAIQRGLSPLSSQNVINNNNNNCQSICNLNEGRGHDYALELSLRLPVSWRTHPSSYTEFPQVRSAFVRYPASPHYS